MLDHDFGSPTDAMGIEIHVACSSDDAAHEFSTQPPFPDNSAEDVEDHALSHTNAVSPTPFAAIPTIPPPVSHEHSADFCNDVDGTQQLQDAMNRLGKVEQHLKQAFNHVSVRM